MKRLSARQQEKYDNATQCDICSYKFVESEAKRFKRRDHDHIKGWFIGAAHRKCSLERPVSFNISLFFNKFHNYDAQLIVHEFEMRLDREIKVIGDNMIKYLHIE